GTVVLAQLGSCTTGFFTTGFLRNSVLAQLGSGATRPRTHAGSGGLPAAGMPVLDQCPVIAARDEIPDDTSAALIGLRIDLCPEAFVVDIGVVSLTEKCGIGQVGRSAVGPVSDVMDLRPGSRSCAAREGAVPVASPDRPSL